MRFRRAIKEMLGVVPDAFVVLENHETGEVRVISGRNIVTDAGDEFYAQSACAEVVTNDFNSLYLATAGPTPTTKADNYGDFTVHAGSEKLATDFGAPGGYPMTNDTDGDNPPPGSGPDIISWKFEYDVADGPFVAIQWSFISIAGAAGVNPVLNSYKWGAAWDKDAATSAKVFANHTVNGV